MDIKYDPETDSLYLSFVKTINTEDSEELYDFIIFDYNSRNEVIGIEFLQVSKRFPKLLQII